MLFIVETECSHFLRTVPVLPCDLRNPDKISDAAENHLADACRYGLRAARVKSRPITFSTCKYRVKRRLSAF
jgi:hypothetical protein